MFKNSAKAFKNSHRSIKIWMPFPHVDNNNMDAGEFLFQYSHASFGKVSCLAFLLLF
jgi:hypothetical protein